MKKMFGILQKVGKSLMLSILLCAYIQGVNSGRKIEVLLHDSIRMRWLAQDAFPDFRTINRFRVSPLMDQLLAAGFLLHVRGTEKVRRETGLVFLAHNFRKIMARVKKYEGKQVFQTLITG